MVKKKFKYDFCPDVGVAGLLHWMAMVGIKLRKDSELDSPGLGIPTYRQQ